MWGSNYVLLPAGRQRGAKAKAAMGFQVREHIIKTSKSEASSEKNSLDETASRAEPGQLQFWSEPSEILN